MSGYVPLFDSLTKGTLCGRWPDIGLWPIVLSLSDKNGVVDVTFGYLASVTGLGADEVKRCMARFCQPDPASRSPDSNGARLTLLDEHRAWGWHIVNHAQYREKARLAAKSAQEVATGVNLKRMQDRRSPPITAADHLSNSDSDSDSNKDIQSKNKIQPRVQNGKGVRLPDDWQPDEPMREFARQLDIDPDQLAAEFRDFWIGMPGQKGRKANWNATWRNRCRAVWERRTGANRPQRKTKFQLDMEALDAATEPES